MLKPISQREARALRKRVKQLEADKQNQNRVWASDWPGGIRITTLNVPEVAYAQFELARKLGRAVVITLAGDSRINCSAVRNE